MLETCLPATQTPKAPKAVWIITMVVVTTLVLIRLLLRLLVKVTQNGAHHKTNEYYANP